jgi:hypothetical protein
MRARLLMVTVAGLSLAAAGAAEPVKAPVQKAAQPANQRVEVAVASASDVRPETAAASPDAAPMKRVRKARVNSCRCGDQPQGE